MEGIKPKVLDNPPNEIIYVSKNGMRRIAYTATKMDKETHNSPLGPVERLVRRTRFLIGQYMDRSKYNGDGTKRESITEQELIKQAELLDRPDVGPTS